MMPPDNHSAADWTVLIVDDEPDNLMIPQEVIGFIVHDEPDNLMIPQEVLSFLGAKVYTAENGEQGMELLATIKPTFILLDLSMPKMDGWEMIKRIRAAPETAKTPVIALTAHAMSGDRERVLEIGFNSYISKPFWFEPFLEEINRCLKEISDAPAPAETPVSEQKETSHGIQ